MIQGLEEFTIHDAHTTVAVEASGAMQSYHPDVRALHEIKLTRAREDQKNVGEAVVAVTSSPVAAIHCAFYYNAAMITWPSFRTRLRSVQSYAKLAKVCGI